jgi:hypothetical protein
MNRPPRIIFAAVTLYASWTAMMAVHESGHVLAALISGGRVRRIVLPLAGFSRTDVDPNPSPRLQVWGGPLWGSVVPLFAWLLVRKKLAKPLNTAMGFFAGLCLVANGAYVGMGWTMSAGDAAELIKLGTPAWVLVVFGATTVILGMYVWHSLGRLGELFAASS